MRRTLLFSLAVLSVWLLSGCASITTGKNQLLSVQTACDNKPLTGANCSLTNSKGQWFVETPGSVVIHKAYGDLIVECKKDDLKPAGGTFQSSSNGSVWGNILAGGVIGYVVDAGSGAGFDYPTQLLVNFNPPCGDSP